MPRGASYIVGYRRKRESKTDYKQRLNMLKSGKPRLVIRPSNKHITVQLVEYQSGGDKILSQANSSKLKEYGWKQSTSNLPAAYLTGLLCAIQSDGGKAVLDAGLHPSVKGSRIYAALKGALDGGVDVKCNEEILPSEDRIHGKHINDGKPLTGFDAVKKKILKDSGKQ